MGIFDIFGGTNKFKKGMEAGAKPFEAKFAQHAEALKRLEKNFGEQWKQTKGVADTILNHVEENDRARLYGLYAQINIRELKQDEKEFIVSALYTLSAETSSEFQQSYIRSVQKYLDIKNPTTRIDFESLENFERLTAQKAIFQACIEYLFLGNNGLNISEQYEEILFNHFSLTGKAMLEILDNVLDIYTATGPLGLAEKYGFVTEGKVDTISTAKLEDVDITSILHIPEGRERKFYENRISVLADINCEGTLTFEKCHIKYDITKGIINCKSEASVSFINCYIECINPSIEVRWGFNHLPFVYNRNGRRSVIENSILSNCIYFMSGQEFLIKNSIINYDILIKSEFYSCGGYNGELENCIINNIGGIDRGPICTELYHVKKCTACTFINLEFVIKASALERCIFEKCRNIFLFGWSDGIRVNDCLFNKCSDIIRFERCSFNVFSYNQFIDCNGSLTFLKGGSTVEFCEFYNTTKGFIEFNVDANISKRFSRAYIKNCLFNGFIIDKPFISGGVSRPPLFKKDQRDALRIENCKFMNYKSVNNTEISVVDTYDAIHRAEYPALNTPTAVYINLDCIFDPGEKTGVVQEVPIRHETGVGDPIGARLDESTVGIPGYNIESLRGE
jgi:hypothetical protein